MPDLIGFPLATVLAATVMCGSLRAASTAEVLLHDSSRNRDVPVKLYYPNSGSGSFPLIVFSHGFGGTKDGHEYLGKSWTDAGYVVILPTHIGSDHDAFLRVGGKIARDPGEAFELQRQRTVDLSFILSSLDKIEQQVADIRGKIDRQRIGVAGHSVGAGSAMLVGGAPRVPRTALCNRFVTTGSKLSSRCRRSARARRDSAITRGITSGFL